MADIQSNIDINIDTTNALSSIKNLQRQISLFHQGLRASGSAANAAISDNMSRNLINSINASKQFAASYATVQSATQSFTTSLEKNKFSMGQYFKYAGASTKTFGRLFKTEFDTIERVAQSRVKTLQTQFIQLGRAAGGGVKAIRVRPLALDMEQLATKTAIAAQKQQLFNQLIKQGSTNLLNFGKNTQWAGRQLMVGFTVPLAYLGTTAARVFMDMEKQIIRLRRVYGDFATTTADTEKMVTQIKQLGTEFTKYGVAVSKTMGLAADAAAMGKQGADLLAQVSEANRLAVLGGVEQAQALETTISITNAFGVAAEDLAGKINFLNAVENQSVTSIEDLTVAIPKAGPVIQQLGGNVEDLTFFLTAMREGGINASESANALKSGLASLINPSAKASEFMNGFGISIKGIVDSNAGDVKGIVIDMANALDTLDPLNRARAIEQMFGKFQFARISTLFQNVVKEGSQASTVLGLTKATSQELAILSERELKKVEDSPMFKFQKAIEDIKTSLIPLGEQFLKLITPIIEFGTQALEQFNKLDSGVKNFIMGAIGVLGGLAPAAIMAFGLIANGIANLIKTGNFLRNMFVRAGQGTTILGQQTQYMTSEQLEAAAAAASLNQAHQKLTQQFTVEATAVRKLADAYNAAAIAGAKLTAAGASGRTRAGGAGGGKAKGYKSGVLSVPGPKGAGDVVPAMLAPGEAVIPADKAKKYRGFISDMIQDRLPGFNGGTDNVKKNSNSRNLDIKGTPFILPKAIDDISQATIIKEVGALEKRYPGVGLHAAQMLEDDESSFRTSADVVKRFRRHAIMLATSTYATSMETVVDDMIDDPKIRKTVLGNVRAASGHFSGISKSVATEVREDRSRGKDMILAMRLTRSAYQSMIADGMSPTQAANKSGWDPENFRGAGKQYGVERGHNFAGGGNLKMLPEYWSSPYVSLDPRVENVFLSTLSDPKNTGQVSALESAMTAVAKQNPKLKDSLDSLRNKIRTNGSFTEEERLTFAKVVKELRTNSTTYSAGIGKADKRRNFQNDLKYLDDMYTKNEKYLKQEYRRKNPDSASGMARSLDEKLQAKAEASAIKLLAKNPKTVLLRPGSFIEGGQALSVQQQSQVKQQTTGFRTPRMPGRRYAKGVVSVPGPKGAGDVVPAMLSPGEAVIPAGMAKKYGPLISGMIAGTLPGYELGYDPNNPFGDIGGKKSIAQRAKDAAQKGKSVLASASSAAAPIASQLKSSLLPIGKQVGSDIGSAAGKALRSAGRGTVNIMQNGFARAASRFSDSGFYDSPTGKRYLDGKSENRARRDAARSGFGIDESGQYTKENKKGKPVVVQDQKAAQAQIKADRKQIAAQRSGRMAQGAMGLSMATGALSMVPGSIGQAAQTAMGPIAGMTAAMSLIPGKAGLVVGAVAAIGIAIMQVKDNFEKFRAEAGKTALAMSAGKSSMKTLGEFAGRVSASETMARIRQDESSPYNIKTGKNTFGGGYLQSEAGSGLVGSIRKTRTTSGEAVAVSDMATQLSQAVAGNILTKEEAASIAYNLGAELKDYDFSASVLGKMTQILGPNGEDLTKQPLEIAARIIQEKQTSLGSVENAASVKGLISTDTTAFGGFGMMGTGIRGNATEVNAAEQKYAQGFQDILDMGQQNIDNLELAHRARVDELIAAGDLVAVEKERDKFAAKRATLQAANAEAIRTESEYISSLENSGSAVLASSARQIVDNIEASRKLLFSEMDEPTKNAANQLIERVANEGSLSLGTRATLTAGITVENMEDYQQLQVLFPINQKSETWQKIADVAVKYGAGAQDQLVGLAKFFGTSAEDKQVYDVFVNYASTNANGQQMINDLTEITRVTQEISGTPIKMTDLIDTETGEPTQKLLDLQSGIKKVSDAIIKNKGKAIKFSVQTVGFELSESQIDYFNSLPADQQKVYTTTFLTVEKTITEDQIKAFRNAKIAGTSNAREKDNWASKTDDQIRQIAAEEAAYSDTEAFTKNDAKTTGGDAGDTTGGGDTNPLDALLKRLKEIRQGAVNASGGIKEMLKWMKPGALAGKDGSPVFNGLEQQLGKQGYRKDFIDFITSADDKIRSQYVTIKNGIITVKKEGVALQKLFDALSLGEYERSVKAAVDASKQELDARKELLKNQMPYAEAIEAARDATFAQNLLIAKSIKNEKERAKAIEKVIALYKEQKKAAEDVKTEEEQFNDLFAKVSKKFDADRNKITIDFELKTSTDKGVVAAAQQQLNEIRNQIDDYNAGLTRLEPAEENINKKYDERIASLENIRDLNDRIAEQKEAELDISAALARGDVSAAAAAIQKEQQRQAQEAMDAKIKNLEKQREAEINSLTTRVQVNGQTLLLTKEEINKRIKDLETQIFNIEEDRLEPAQARIDLAMYERDVKLKALDDEKIKWDQLKNKIDLAATAAINYAEALKEAIRLADIAAKNYSNPTAPKAPKEENWDQAYLTKATMDSITKANPRLAEKLPEMLANSSSYDWSKIPGMSGSLMYKAKGGMIPSYFANGDLARGTDTVPAMLTPGEFIMSKYAVDTYGTDTMKAINSGELSGGSVYNSYAVNVNVRSDANPDQIARAVMGQIRQVNSQQLRGNRF